MRADQDNHLSGDGERLERIGDWFSKQSTAPDDFWDCTGHDLREIATRLSPERDDADELRDRLRTKFQRWIDHHAKEERGAVATATRESHCAAKEAFEDCLKEVDRVED